MGYCNHNKSEEKLLKMTSEKIFALKELESFSNMIPLFRT